MENRTSRWNLEQSFVVIMCVSSVLGKFGVEDWLSHWSKVLIRSQNEILWRICSQTSWKPKKTTDNMSAALPTDHKYKIFSPCRDIINLGWSSVPISAAFLSETNVHHPHDSSVVVVNAGCTRSLPWCWCPAASKFRRPCLSAFVISLSFSHTCTFILMLTRARAKLACSAIRAQYQ